MAVSRGVAAAGGHGEDGTADGGPEAHDRDSRGGTGTVGNRLFARHPVGLDRARRWHRVPAAARWRDAGRGVQPGEARRVLLRWWNARSRTGDPEDRSVRGAR